MKKIYMYFILFFIGSVLPFLIVEIYFQNYVTTGLITLLSSLILTLCLLLEYLKEKVQRLIDTRNKKYEYFNWEQKKENPEKQLSYYLRNIW